MQRHSYRAALIVFLATLVTRGTGCAEEQSYASAASFLGGAGGTATNAEYSLVSSWRQAVQTSITTGGEYENSSGFLAALSEPLVSLPVNGWIIYATVQLQGFTGTGPRTVQFVASDSGGVPLQTNDVSLTFAGSPKVADYQLSVPTNTVYLSAKTGWNLRRRQAVTFTAWVATNNFTGSGGQLLGGDINQNNNQVNTADYTLLKENWLKGTESGDITGDGLVNTADYTILKGNWLKVGDPP